MRAENGDGCSKCFEARGIEFCSEMPHEVLFKLKPHHCEDIAFRQNKIFSIRRAFSVGSLLMKEDPALTKMKDVPLKDLNQILSQPEKHDLITVDAKVNHLIN